MGLTTLENRLARVRLPEAYKLYIMKNPGDVGLFLTLTTQRNNDSLLFRCFEDISMYSISYDSLSNEPDAPVVVELDFPYKASSELLGSCNGLVYGWNHHKEFFFLLNPATKGYKRLPETPDTYNYYRELHGFGYDHKTDDYKLVTINKNVEGNNLVQVCSLKSKSWKSFQSSEYEFHSDERSGVLLMELFIGPRGNV
ncbi:F-box protein CPR1-like [Papaver somniferum]|uniref:F-box protein CPR1-like n=1 Tax=Papaver somniferum TaxID=3469 RepID=UPI000E6F9C4D|nr:F-box protein CPR1-like [Papaver somniferum]